MAAITAPAPDNLAPLLRTSTAPLPPDNSIAQNESAYSVDAQLRSSIF